MSLVWPAADSEVVRNAPRLHALVIGAGSYPHLTGGHGTQATETFGLGQISTPRFTAPAIATWLAESYRNPACELGSVEVLISPSAPALQSPGAPYAEVATMVNITAACARWLERCDSDADNIAFFYFCGHGLAADTQCALPEDFGDPGLDRWTNCVDIDGLRLNMRRSKAQTQLFFVDACHETPASVLSQLTIEGSPIVTGASLADSVNCSAAFYATSQGRAAFGPDHGVTYFGQAVLACLNGVAAEKDANRWVVSTYQLGSALSKTLSVLARLRRQPLTCYSHATGLARIHEPVSGRVIAALECTSEQANGLAEICLENGIEAFQSSAGEDKPLVEEVEAGIWTITVTFPDGAFPPVGPASYQLMPPVFDELKAP